MSVRKTVRFLAVIALAGAALYAAYWYGSREADIGSDCESVYELINKDAICGGADVIKKTEYTLLRKEIITYLDTEAKNGTLLEYGLYFRDLIRGPTLEINGLAKFVPASLLKLPLAFVFLASAEEQPELLSHKIRYIGTSTSAQSQIIKPLFSPIEGHEYSIEELLRFMIVYSDNVSLDVLTQFIAETPQREEIRNEVHQELGLIDPDTGVEETLTVRGYASLFRLLYNAAYLSPLYSQKLLSWLNDSTFTDGLKRGVPKGVSVANKFGERTNLDTGVRQLHDCGIIYYPDNPYSLCVMTRGTDYTKLADIIATVSKMVYEEVDSRRINADGGR